MHYWNSPGGLFTGSKVHATASVVFHFHVLSFATSGGAALLALGGLGALLRYRCRRLGPWRRASELVAPALESLKAHEDYWCGLRFPCDQIAQTLPQALREQNPTSFNAIVAWRKVLKDTAVLITAINARRRASCGWTWRAGCPPTSPSGTACSRSRPRSLRRDGPDAPAVARAPLPARRLPRGRRPRAARARGRR
ncbi:unnamed protein product, partial [Prorocentrum cordatum]